MTHHEWPLLKNNKQHTPLYNVILVCAILFKHSLHYFLAMYYLMSSIYYPSKSILILYDYKYLLIALISVKLYYRGLKFIKNLKFIKCLHGQTNFSFWKKQYWFILLAFVTEIYNF